MTVVSHGPSRKKTDRPVDVVGDDWGRVYAGFLEEFPCCAGRNVFAWFQAARRWSPSPVAGAGGDDFAAGPSSRDVCDGARLSASAAAGDPNGCGGDGCPSSSSGAAVTDCLSDRSGVRAVLERSCLGGAKGIRTPDLFHAMETRYQLRHSPFMPPARGRPLLNSGCNCSVPGPVIRNPAGVGHPLAYEPILAPDTRAGAAIRKEQQCRDLPSGSCASAIP